MSAINSVLGILQTVRFWDLWQKMNPDVLTVVNYRRVGDPLSNNIFYKPSFSASLADFEIQLDYLQENYNIVSAKDLTSWFKGERDLPDRAALLTFDDCYQDNYRFAYPALKKRWLSAIFLLAAGHVGKREPMFWDLVGLAMERTKKDFLSLNLAGSFNWNSVLERDNNVGPMVEAIRQLPVNMQLDAVGEIITKLDVSIPENAFNDLYLTWEQVHEMVLEGIEMGSKTISLPILTSISMEAATREIVESKKIIEAKTNRPVRTFSYPHGQKGDFNRDIMKILHQAGYRMAFTNLNGPDDYDVFPKRRFAMRRISVNSKDTFPRFVAKLNGLPQATEFIGKYLN